ncbi:MAG: NAD(P)H-dependent oxidoreductase [Leadbetterella sp.]|nr:NAD(P)H-dependent oxidoreductase [Leadbetterella sp.]
MAATKKVLLINTHLKYPTFSDGNLNASFYKVAKDFFLSKDYEVLETMVEDGYKPDEEEKKHLEADIVILQMPANWFGAPWIYKKYVDEVFNYALYTKSFLLGDGRTPENPTAQYGTGGLMQGKKFMVCATWNAPLEAFDDPNQVLLEGRGMADLLLPITSNYHFCGYDIMDSFNCFNIYRRTDIGKDVENYPAHLAEVFGL